METNRLTLHPILQRVLTLNKQSLTNLTVPLWHRSWQRQTSTNSDITVFNPTPLPPTYALTPHKIFDFSRAQKLLQSELNHRCGKISKQVRYDPQLSYDLVRDLAQQLRRVIKPDYLNHSRYKLIVLVSIVQITPSQQIHQSMTIASRCLWNDETDNSMTVQTKLGYDMCAIATAFAVYTD